MGVKSHDVAILAASQLTKSARLHRLLLCWTAALRYSGRGPPRAAVNTDGDVCSSLLTRVVRQGPARPLTSLNALSGEPVNPVPVLCKQEP